MKKLIPVLVALLTICNSHATLGQAFSGPFIKKVVIDPGHGGRDPGALSPDKKIREKDINLAVSKYLGQEINTHYPEIEVLYTRQKDVAVDLDKRGIMASEQHADVFISIHVNSARRSTSVTVGPETWVFGGDRSQRRDDSYDVVLKENEVIKFEEDYKTKYEGFDPDNPQSMIVFNFQKEAIMRQSKILGSCIQQSLRKGPLRGTEKDRGMKEGGFVVLAYCSMPAVLVELGFINSAMDRKVLGSTDGQKKLARQLFLGFEDYLKTYAENGKMHEKIPEDKKPASVYYHIQVAASKTALPQEHMLFKSHPDIKYIVCEDHIYTHKYFLGSFADLKEASVFCEKIREKHFPDAFVIAVQNGKLVPIIP
jgi:N-acetylmuramoyl-L-alanine amidase